MGTSVRASAGKVAYLVAFDSIKASVSTLSAGGLPLLFVAFLLGDMASECIDLSYPRLHAGGLELQTVPQTKSYQRKEDQS